MIGTDSVRWGHVGVFLFEKSSIRCDTTVECRFAGGVACVRRQYKHVGAFDAHVSSERGNLTTERGVDSAAIIRSIEVKKKDKRRLHYSEMACRSERKVLPPNSRISLGKHVITDSQAERVWPLFSPRPYAD